MQKGVFNMNEYEKILEQLKKGELSSYKVNKEDFLKFREVLVKHEQFKHYRGEAQQGGDIIYTYLAEQRS
jgi:hypothetical protein